MKSAPKQRVAAVAATAAVDVAVAAAVELAVVEFDGQRGFLQPPLPRHWLENLGPF